MERFLKRKRADGGGADDSGSEDSYGEVHLSKEQRRILKFATTPRAVRFPDRGWAYKPTPATVKAYKKMASPYPNIFLTGEAGTGKSTLIRAIVQRAKEQGRNVAITASTGVAAVNCGGMTIHRFMGCGAPRIWKDFESGLNGKSAKGIKKCDLLIIDEISALSGEYLLGMDRIAAMVRAGLGNANVQENYPHILAPFMCCPLCIDKPSWCETCGAVRDTWLNSTLMPPPEMYQKSMLVESILSLAFGGIQVIFVGDFFQLGPIMKRHESSHSPCEPPHALLGLMDRYFPGCPPFTLRGMLWPDNLLITDRISVRQYAFESSSWERAHLHSFVLRKIHRQENAEFKLLLKQLRNGKLDGPARALLVRCERDLDIPQDFRPICLEPLNRAVDIINKRELEGLPGRQFVCTSLDSVVVSPHVPVLQREAAKKRLWKRGRSTFWDNCQAKQKIELKIMANVMLLKNLDVGRSSRPLCNGSRGVVINYVESYDLWDYENEWIAMGYINKRNAHNVIKDAVDAGSGVPVVRFQNGRIMPIFRAQFSVDIFRVGSCHRWQIPLRLSYAMTINKSQGLTLDWCQVNLRNAFDNRHAYVAISRVRSLDTLQIKGFNEKKIWVLPHIKQHWNAISFPHCARLFLMFYRRARREKTHLIALFPDDLIYMILRFAAPEAMVKRPRPRHITFVRPPKADPVPMDLDEEPNRTSDSYDVDNHHENATSPAAEKEKPEWDGPLLPKLSKRRKFENAPWMRKNE